MDQENFPTWNETVAQGSLSRLNQTTAQGEMEEDVVEEMWGNFTEGDLLSFNSTDEDDGTRIVGGTFCRPGDCPWQVHFPLKALAEWPHLTLLDVQWDHCIYGTSICGFTYPWSEDFKY